MDLISREQFLVAVDDATIRIVDGQVSVSSSDVIEVRWDEQINYVAFAKSLMETVVTPEQIICFHEFGIWPSSENPYLFRVLTKAFFGEELSSPRSRYFQFGQNDRDAATTLLQIGLQSGWGGLMFGRANNWIYFNHDGLGLVQSGVSIKDKFSSLAGVTMSPARPKSIP